MSPFDLLLLSPDVQQVVRCLLREPLLTIAEITVRTRLPQRKVRAVVSSLLTDESLTQHGDRFQVALQQHTPVSGGLLDALYR